MEPRQGAASAAASASRSPSRSTGSGICHCAFCKRISGGYGTVSGRARTDAIRILAGEELLTSIRARRRIREDVLLALRDEPLRRRLARAPRRQRAASHSSSSRTTGSPRRTPSCARSLPGRCSRTTAFRATTSGRRNAGPCRRLRHNPATTRSELDAALRDTRLRRTWLRSSRESRRIPHEPRPRALRRGVRAPALARRRGLAGRDPGDRRLPRAPAGRHARTTHGDRQRAPHPGGRGGRDRRDRPRRQVDVPRAGTARLLPDPRPREPRQGREALRARPRGGAHPHACRIRPRGDAVRRADRRLDAAGWRSRPAEDRVDRRPRLALGHDARLRAQRRPRPGAVHRVDHRLRARGRQPSRRWRASSASRDGRRRATGRDRRGRGGVRPRFEELPATRAQASGRSRSTPRWRLDDGRRSADPAARLGSAAREGASASSGACSCARRTSSSRSSASPSTRRSEHPGERDTIVVCRRGRGSRRSPTRPSAAGRSAGPLAEGRSRTASGRRARP